ncbi:MAG TPA: protease modulator HflC [Gemmataceae bacterium]|nr:protease modulator HflC [Gemmataceae bacterium]
MRRKWILFLVLIAALAVVVGGLSIFTVDRTEFVYLTQFGRPIAVFDGADDAQAGLHFRLPWPIQSVQRLDRRLQYFDLPGAELLTRDPAKNTIDKTLTIDAYVCWRIADAGSVDPFIRRMGTIDHANSVLGQRLTSALGAAVGKLELDDLISTEQIPVGDGKALEPRVDHKRDELRAALLNGDGQLRETARREWGIEIVDVRLRRTNHPPAVRQAIFDRIISEREKKSAAYRSDGERQAADIKSASDRKVAEMRTEAESQALRLRGQADADADKIRSDAAKQDPQFYTFLNKLEDYKRILGDNKTMLLLSTHREWFDALWNPPTPGGAAPVKPTPPASPTTPATKGAAP